MPDLVYSKDGENFFELEDNEENRVLADQKGYKQFVDMYKTDQEDYYTLPVEESTAALQKGYKIRGIEPAFENEAPKDEGMDVAGKVTAGGLGVLQGLPFIGTWTDEMLEKVGVDKEQIQAAMDKYPKLSTSAEILTALAIPVPGPNKARALGKLATSVGEGIVSGAGAGVEADRTSGAAISGGLASVFGIPAAGLRSKKLQDVAKDRALKGVGVTPAKLKKVSQRYGKDIENSVADLAREKKLMSGLSPDGAHKKASALLEKTGKEIGGVLDGLHKEQIPVNMERAMGDLKHILLSKFDDPSKIADKEILREYNKIAEEIIPELANKAKTGSWQDFSNMREYLRKQLVTRGDMLPVSKKEYKDSIVALDDVITNQLKQVSPELGDKYRKLKTEYGALKTIEEGLSKKKGESPWEMAKRGKLIEGAGKAIAAPILNRAEKAVTYTKPKTAAGLAELIDRSQRPAARALSFKKEKKK